ncbi:TPA: hypothetical protein ACH3X1_008780 [Trebouxia sp. C0004]
MLLSEFAQEHEYLYKAVEQVVVACLQYTFRHDATGILEDHGESFDLHKLPIKVAASLCKWLQNTCLIFHQSLERKALTAAPAGDNIDLLTDRAPLWFNPETFRVPMS